MNAMLGRQLGVITVLNLHVFMATWMLLSGQKVGACFTATNELAVNARICA
jgi:hypothetical protein